MNAPPCPNGPTLPPGDSPRALPARLLVGGVLSTLWLVAASPAAGAATPEAATGAPVATDADAPPEASERRWTAAPGVWLVRDRARPDETIARKLRQGTALHVLDRAGAWLLVELEGGAPRRGYVMASLTGARPDARVAVSRRRPPPLADPDRAQRAGGPARAPDR